MAAGDPVLAGVEKKRVESIMSNPFLLLLDPELVSKVRARLDHLVGLDAVQAMRAHGDLRSPLTRQPISSLLAFGREREHVRATDYALADLFLPGHKLVGQPELWLAVVYFIVQDEVTYLRDEAAFMSAFGDHLTHRMRSHSSILTLSGLPIEPMIRAPVDIAVWYCAVSPYVWQTNGDKDKDCNRLRAFGPTARTLLRLVDVLGFAYPRQELLHWCALYKAFAWMMNEEKTPGSQWRTLLRAQVQKSMRVGPDGTIILLDGPADTRPPLPSFAVTRDGPAPSLAKLFALARLVNASKTVNAVFVPRELATTGVVPPVVYNYAYPRGSDPDQRVPELSPATMRPVVMDRAQRKHWLACAQERMGTTDMRQQLSMYNYYIGYVHAHHAFPSRDAYVVYVAAKQAAREDGGAADTLPEHMAQYVELLFGNYARLPQVSVEDFVRLTKASMPRDARAALDGSDALI